MEDVLQVVKISTDIGTVAFFGMVSKNAKGNHVPIRIKIFVHGELSFEM